MSSATKKMPEEVRAIRRCGYVTWASEKAPGESFRKLFDNERIPVTGVRQVRVWGIQVDDERELPGRERTSIPDEEIWEINLRAKDGSCYEVASGLLKPSPG